MKTDRLFWKKIREKKKILLLSIIGEVEGHEAAPNQNKSDKI